MVTKLASTVDVLSGAMPPATEAERARRLLVDGLDLDYRSRRLFTDGRSIRLSSTEATLLHLLMLYVDEVVSYEDIFARVWGYDFNGNVNIIHTYISYLRRKIPSGGARIRTVRGLGYVLSADEAPSPTAWWQQTGITGSSSCPPEAH